MRAFTCDNCGQLLFFENSLCLRCDSRLGFLPSKLRLEIVGAEHGAGLRRCANAGLAGCNWLLEPGEEGGLCRSCALTRTRPADGDSDGLARFADAERAKRRLIFQLLDLGLPIEADLHFDLLSSAERPVVTGHSDGLITLDLAESDDAQRERRRVELNEPYRTVLGHFRHEIGHYYWPILVERRGRLDRCRELFGDERADYQGAVERHYSAGPPRGFEEHHVSAYATMHPWEDWAETFAHYLHLRDTLQTAAEFGIVIAGPAPSSDPSLMAVPSPEAAEAGFPALLESWLPLAYALNAINRSMGAGDLYPFVLGGVVVEKLSFVHDCVVGR
jgi:hypothetical protein